MEEALVVDAQLALMLVSCRDLVRHARSVKLRKGMAILTWCTCSDQPRASIDNGYIRQDHFRAVR